MPVDPSITLLVRLQESKSVLGISRGVGEIDSVRADLIELQDLLLSILVIDQVSALGDHDL